MSLDIKIEGSQELMKLFADMPKQLPDKVLQAICRKAAQPVVTEARRNVSIDGELDRPAITKKVIRAVADKDNPTAVRVTISNNYVNYKGKRVSVGKIFRHLSAGPQEERKKRNAKKTGKVANRVGDFIERAFERKKDRVLKVISDQTIKILKRRAAKYL